MDQIRNALRNFKKVSLPDLDQVKLMNRTDLKFCLPVSQLPSILEEISDHYAVLQIDGETIFHYDNTYFDTNDNQMFICHHNGNGNRFKIRVRQYVESDINFLEIKHKNNKGRTIKKRVVRTDFHSAFTPDEMNFIQQVSPYSALQLEPKMKNFFNRFTMVDNHFTERVTVDLKPTFKNQNNEITLNNLVIIEIKQDKASNPAHITNVLRSFKVRGQGFSKYCIGRSLLEENIKKNNFKPLLLKLEKEYC